MFIALRKEKGWILLKETKYFSQTDVNAFEKLKSYVGTEAYFKSIIKLSILNIIMRQLDI